MKFDPKKPYGIVTGHPWAQFTQNDVLFDVSGNTQEEVNDPNDDTLTDFELTSAKEFLVNILSGGPVSKAAVFKEAELNNQNADKVKTAFAEMNGISYKVKSTVFYRLPEKEMA